MLRVDTLWATLPSEVPCYLQCCSWAGTGFYPLIHLLPAANTWDQSPFQPPEELSSIAKRPFLHTHHFKRPLSELADGPHLWTASSKRYIQCVEDGSPFVPHGSWLLKPLPVCYVPSSLASFPQPSSGSHSNSVIRESCHLMWTSRDFGWEGSAHSQPKH